MSPATARSGGEQPAIGGAAWALVRVPSVGGSWVEAEHVGLVRPAE